jgi:hypothetical protein
MLQVFFPKNHKVTKLTKVFYLKLRTISFLAKVYGFLNLLDLSLMEKARIES